MSDWIPGTEQGRLDTLSAFSRVLAERPEVYGASREEAAEAVRLVGAMEATFAVIQDPARRTALTTAAKTQAFMAGVSYCRRLAAFIKLKPNLSEGDLRAIGLRPKGPPRRYEAPSTAPMLSIRRVVPGGHEIEAFDSATPGRRAKPEGVSKLELFVAYSPSVAGEPGLSMDTIVKAGKSCALLTRVLATVTHPDDRLGKTANYIGRWINNRGEAGPWSQPARMVLAMPGDGMLNAAA